jgi:hypothetical protein
MFTIRNNTIEINSQAFIIAQVEMSKAFTTGILIQVDITILDLNFDRFTNTITEQDEILFT